MIDEDAKLVNKAWVGVGSAISLKLNESAIECVEDGFTWQFEIKSTIYKTKWA